MDLDQTLGEHDFMGSSMISMFSEAYILLDHIFGVTNMLDHIFGVTKLFWLQKIGWLFKLKNQI